MAASPRRVVITGIGVVSPLGRGMTAFWEALLAGRGAVGPLRSFDASGFPVSIGAEVENFDARDYLEKKDRKSLKMMVRTIQLAVAGARTALDDAAVQPGSLEPSRFGVVFGTGTIPGELGDLGPAALASYDRAANTIDLKHWGRDGMSNIPPMWMLNHVPNMPACHVAILNNAQGPNNTITVSDAAGLLALGEAIRVIQRGAADAMLAGGADTRTNPISLLRYCLFGRLSRCRDAARACRPFDRDRSGQVLGEGAGVLMIEELEHARQRGARIWAEIVGFGSAFDPGRKGDGIARAAHFALQQAGVDAEQIDHVNAHAPGTIEDDAWEASGLQKLFAARTVPVLALKGYFGNLGPGAAVTELAGSLAALHHGQAPATLNHDNPAADCPVHVIRELRPVRKPYVLKLACTELGQCAAVVVRRWE